MPCPHGRQESQCKECGGASICTHGRIKSKCKACGGASICTHGRIKSSCKECGGASICTHGRERSKCKECGGASICTHGRIKSKCKACGGASICTHGRQKSQCKECGGASICTHGRRESQCKECGGSSICTHGRQKSQCKECGGSALCKTPHCETTGIKKYNGYCMPCCVQVCPDIPVARNYKTKEKDVVDRIRETFPNFTWRSDKKIEDGCSLKRPDLLLDMGSHLIIVEVDEHKHNNYDCSCEHKRLMQLSFDVGHRPIVFLRFNPDSYIDQNGQLVKSCWKLNKLGVMQVSKTDEWLHRIDVLKTHIQYWVDHPNTKMVEIIELFYGN